jgi:hypothetical protein
MTPVSLSDPGGLKIIVNSRFGNLYKVLLIRAHRELREVCAQALPVVLSVSEARAS